MKRNRPTHYALTCCCFHCKTYLHPLFALLEKDEGEEGEFEWVNEYENKDARWMMKR